jgi:hypothetical protein
VVVIPALSQTSSGTELRLIAFAMGAAVLGNMLVAY